MRLPNNQGFGVFNASMIPDKGVGAVGVRVNMYYHAHGIKPSVLTPRNMGKQDGKRRRLDFAPNTLMNRCNTNVNSNVTRTEQI